MIQTDMSASIRRQSVNRYRRWLMGLMAAVFCLAIGFGHRPAMAHRPHDVVIAVELSPRYSQDQTGIIVVRNNLFKTVDGGATWRRLVQGIDTPFPFSSLTQDDVTGQTLLAGTQGAGIYRSTDGGESWTATNQGLDAEAIQWVELLPGQSDTALTAPAEGGLYRTTDGQNWTAVLETDTPVTAIAFAPDGAVWLGDMTGQLYQSTDQGQTWKSILQVADDSINAIALLPDGALYAGTAFNGVFAVDLASQQATAINQGLDDIWVQDLQAIPGSNDGLMVLTWDQGTAISQDRGQTWTVSNEGLEKDKQADEFEETHFHQLAFSGTYAEDSVVWMGTFNGLAISDNGGQRWQRVDTLDRDTVIAMDISPNYAEDGTLAIATYVGKVMMSRDQGQTWQLTMDGMEVPRLNGGYQERYQDPRRFFDIAFSPTYAQDDTLFAGLLWTKLLRSTNDGTSWSLHSLDKELRGLTFAISPNFAKDKTAFVSNQGGQFYRSTNGGKSWQNISELPWENGNDNPSLVISPNFTADRTIYGVGATGVYRSTDSGETWVSTTENTELASLGMLKLAISPAYGQDQTVYAGSSMGLYRTTDSGDSWQPVTNLTDRIIEAVTVSPDYANDGTVMVSVRGSGLLKSTDRGESFSEIGEPTLPFSMMYTVPASGRPLQFSPNYASDQTLYGFGAAGREIYRSTDGGSTWAAVSLPDLDENAPPGLSTKVSVAAYLYRSQLLKLSAALVAALAVYVGTGLLRLHKLLGLNRHLVQIGSAAVTFAIAIVVLVKVL